MRVAITRPKADAEPFAEALRKIGVEPVLEPLMFIKNIEGSEVNLAPYQALLVTSANGVRALEARTSEREIKVFAVGDASAQAALAAKFKNVESSRGNIETLAQLVIERTISLDGPLLHVAGTRVAGDLSGLLEAAGFKVRREVLYGATFIESLSSNLTHALEREEIDGVAFFSPRTATAFVELAKKANLNNLKSVTAFCLSKAVADNTLGISWHNISVAKSPDQASLLVDVSQAAADR